MNKRINKKINSKVINSKDNNSSIHCPYCNSCLLKKNGMSTTGKQRYFCNNCKRSFTYTDKDITLITFSNEARTRLIIDILNRIYSNNCTDNVVRESKNVLNKIFVVLKNINANMKLFGDKIAISELYLNFINDSLEHKNHKIFCFKKQQKMCIGVALDIFHFVAIYEGIGLSNKETTASTFSKYIKFKSTIHDNGNKIYKDLISKQNLKEIVTKKISDSKDPLTHLERIKSKLFTYLSSVKDLNGTNIQDFLNLYCFLMNKPKDLIIKVDEILTDYVTQLDFLKEINNKSQLENA